MLVVAFVATALVGLSVTPPVQRWLPGPSDAEVRYSSEKARADDLARQNRELTAKLKKGRPPVVDGVAKARADDLKRHVKALETKLGEPRPDSQAARADDLQEQLRRAEEELRKPRPNPGDPEAVARAEDLKDQVDALAEELARPRPAPDPLAGVTATLTRDQIAAADHLFGLYTEQAPFDFGEIDLVEYAVQRRADIIGYFQFWNEGFRADALKLAWKQGRVPLMTWEPRTKGGDGPDEPAYSLPTIIGGAHDEYIRSYARGIVDTGLPLILRFAHEMNGDWYPWSEVRGWDGAPLNGNRRGDYAKAWRHIHHIFEQEGANDLTVWLWSPNRVDRVPSQPPPADFYPGDDVVDWVGMSGYHREYGEAPTFEETYGRTLPLLREAGPGKPLFLSEIGATETNDQKVEWITDLFVGLADNPDIIGFAWFNLTITNKIDGDRHTNDWRINSSAGPAAVMALGLAAHGYGRPPG